MERRSPTPVQPPSAPALEVPAARPPQPARDAPAPPPQPDGPSAAPPAPDADDLVRAAGLPAPPSLEEVDRRRAQLWLIGLAIGLALPWLALLAGGDLAAGRTPFGIGLAASVAVLVAVLGYVAERERSLRRLAGELVDERARSAGLVARVEELDLLLRASHAVNASLELDAVLDIILRAACELVGAPEGSVQLVPADAPGELEVVTVHGTSMAVRGQRQRIDESFAGRSVQGRAPLALLGPQPDSAHPRPGAALVVPLVHRGELVGVLNIRVPSRVEPFTEVQQRSVSLFAETAAAAASNARLHHATQASVQALTELDRLKEDFLAQVTHELRTPLTSVIGLAQTIERGIRRLPPDRVAELARLIVGEGWRLDRLVDELLRTSAAQRGAAALDPEPVDVGALIGSTVAGLRAADAEHVLTLEVPATPILRVVDGDAIARIVANLVGNAVKYTPPGSRVVVALRGDHNGDLVLTVDDDGPGIPPAQWEQIFDKFRRGEGRGSGGGMGLGLYLVRTLAQAHGGDAVVADSPLGGCRFTVRLADLARTPA